MKGCVLRWAKDDSWAKVIEQSYLASEGAHVFNSLFQGEPSNEKGNLFKSDDWKEYEMDKVWSTENRLIDLTEFIYQLMPALKVLKQQTLLVWKLLVLNKVIHIYAI